MQRKTTDDVNFRLQKPTQGERIRIFSLNLLTKFHTSQARQLNYLKFAHEITYALHLLSNYLFFFTYPSTQAIRQVGKRDTEPHSRIILVRTISPYLIPPHFCVFFATHLVLSHNFLHVFTLKTGTTTLWAY